MEKRGKNNRKGQWETGRILFYLVITLAAFALIAYFGYSIWKDRAVQLKDKVPLIAPLAFAPLGRLFKQNKRGMDPAIMTIVGLILLAIFIIVLWAVLGKLLYQ